ncbi:NBR1-Ig-like domain-containing protein [Micromonospora peucetia]|uniref:Helix-turn-helix domain-containing protein n=1 Tax=Micromonospora peucetia TaxID=47871 RepID=A0A1C6W4U8_9ACTN|nr:NBR1-Ig-like domain-containing protein [Micromonospora peucetia]SCL73557.1 Helix-turn-helix domain-containing protein [Micromonospora peucetia]
MGSKSNWAVIGEIMRSLRSGAGMSLTDASQMMGVSKGHLSHVECGRDRPGVGLIERYEEMFSADGLLWSAYIAARTNRQALPQPAVDGRYPVPGDAVHFIRDVTVPDGTVLPPDFSFRKVWRVGNVGSVLWQGRWLARVGSPFGHGIPWSPSRVRIDDTSQGGVVDIEVPMRTQCMGGTAQVRWKIVDEEGWDFFPDPGRLGLLLTIIVDEDAPSPPWAGEQR